MQKPEGFQGRRLLLPLIVLVPMLLSSAMIAGLLYTVALLIGPRWYFWLFLSPLVYIAWLILFLLICAGGSRRIGSADPKPRYSTLPLGVNAPVGPGVATVIVCMVRHAFVSSLPMVHGLEKFFWFRKLVLRSYSPSIHVGKDALIWGEVMDPDLTEIGERAVIGSSAEVIAHSVTSRPDGSLAYVSAPIRIGAAATIGGSAYIALGAVIGEGAVVEHKSYVAPFTVIPAGETWGGSPARRVRGGPGAPAAVHPDVQLQLDLEGARKLVAFALGINANAEQNEWSAESIPQWDSLGQVAIATALFDRHGITVNGDQVFHLRTLQDVAAAIAGKTPVPAKTAAEGPRPDVLPDDRELLPLGDPESMTRALTARFADVSASNAIPLRVIIASSFTAQPLAATMKVWGRAFGLELECEFAGFGQISQALLAGNSPFLNNPSGVNIVLVDPSDRVFESAEHTDQAIDDLLNAIDGWKGRQPPGSQTLIGTLPPVVSAFATVHRAGYERLREHWRSRIAAMPHVQLFDFAAVVEHIGMRSARNNEGDAIARMPYSPAMYQALGIALVRQILAARRSPAKVIAVDCDNTLWGGVIGESRLDEISLASDGVGRSFQLFQKYLKQLKDRGLLLTVVSRNEEADVQRVFREHPGMVLRGEDITAWSVNWNSKAENLRELADKLRLGIDSFVFLDDDPAVRAEVAMRLPGIHVVPLPVDPSLYCETLEKLWIFDGMQTDADRTRTQLMQEEQQRDSVKHSAASLEEYLTSLDLEVEVREPLEGEWARVAQLTQRTNQFNLSLRRRTVEELRSLSDCTVLILKARDRFGDYGLVGLCVVHKTPDRAGEIDTLLMSCRVLGRGVEDAFLRAIADTATRHGAKTLTAPFVEGPRNRVIREFIEAKGFREIRPGNWVLPIPPAPDYPAHVRWSGHMTVLRNT